MSKTTLVKNAAELVKAAKTARSGDTILLASGEYGAVSLANLNTGGNVTIKSANVHAPASFYSLNLTRDTGFTFQDIAVNHGLKNGEALWSSAINLNGSSNISIIHSDINGSVDGNASNDAYGIMSNNSDHITVLNSTFEELKVGMVMAHSSDVIFAGNTITTSREGVDIGDSHGVLIDRNYVTNLQPNYGALDHPDAFQIGAAGMAVSSDVTFSNNVIIEGTAGPVGGIFIRNEKNADGSLHSNIVIQNNYYSGSYTNAIGVSDVRNLLVDNNTVVMSAKPGNTSAITGNNLHNATYSDNVAPVFLSNKGTVLENVDYLNNIDLKASKGKAGLALTDLFVAPANNVLDLGNLNPIAGSVAALKGIGFHSAEGIGQLGGSIDQQLATYMPMHDHLQANSAML
jgi:hypothetical protein